MARNFSQLPVEQHKTFRKNWKAVRTFLGALKTVSSNASETQSILTVLSIGDYVDASIVELKKQELEKAAEAKDRANSVLAASKAAHSEADAALKAAVKAQKAAKKKSDKEIADKAVADAKASAEAAKTTVETHTDALTVASEAHDAAVDAHEEVSK
jgi:hypothetical protein